MDEDFNVDDLRTNNDTYYRMLGQFCSLNPLSKHPSDADAGNSEIPTKKQRTDQASTSNESPQASSLNILAMPMEVLDKILKYLDYSSLSKARMTGQLFRQSSERILNQGFHRLQSHVHQRFQHIKSQMPRRESARRKHPLARECDILETLHMRLTLLQMTFGKHIERGHCCFFAGEILDEVIRILEHISVTQSLGRAYKVTDELFDLTTMAMEFFKEKIEPSLPEITYFSTDFSDLSPSSSLSPGHRTIVFSLDSPATTAKSSPTLSYRPSSPATSPQRSPKLPQSIQTGGSVERSNTVVNSLRRTVRKASREVTLLKRELKSCRRKVVFQHRQLQETQSKLAQHDRRFEEQNRKMEELLKEMQQCRAELAWNRDSRGQHSTKLPGVSVDGALHGECESHLKEGIEDQKNTFHEAECKSELFGKGGPFKKSGAVHPTANKKDSGDNRMPK